MVIRPLVYVTEAEAGAYCKEGQLPIIGCCCPACGDLSLQRQRVKRLIAELEREHPAVKNSMIKALANVMPRYLLDRRLNPAGEVSPAVAARLAEFLPADLSTSAKASADRPAGKPSSSLKPQAPRPEPVKP